MDVREKLIDLIIDAKRTDPETGSFTEYLADYLTSNGVTVQDNTEISEELLKQLRNAPITILQEEPTVEVVQEWISVKDRLPEEDGKYLVFEQSSGRTNTSILWFAKDARKVDRYDFKGRWKNAWYEYDSEWGHYTVNSVTHWQYLPQPPKGE